LTRLRTQLLLGALAGLVGTAAMTAVMDRAHRQLPAPERYPLPPREITGVLVGEESGREQDATGDLALAAHFGFGAAAGALLAGLRVPARPAPGALAGLVVWAVSYFGWVPLFRILRPAASHPIRRSRLMAAAHLVWGAVTALTLRELRRARAGMFAPGPALDS
jgi:hypothetical protein